MAAIITGMHPFSKLAMRCAALTSSLLEEKREHMVGELQQRGETALVKALQVVELQGALVAVGMVAMFDAALQRALDCEDGFAEALVLIDYAGEHELHARFKDVRDAVNVLKHGRGRSYVALMARREWLPFRVRAEDEFFNEGDVSELATLVQVDSAFLQYCAETIDLVAELIKRQRPDSWV
ncbi:hypothetical protein [Xanthomonas fragariae]|uniref:hypothetical protein n=1 Tax=Xanthomonas fragariae TaxID=48664 RepID=UPI0022AB34F2|nr:hypothetical protein [Xanthomonas fragariae]WAT15229.1 hypothetical protein OZ429_01395 [Xanthomonas fragariae]